ncbi:MAG: NAD+ synthase [Scytolyngbya sp. HA4215-MV1]|nr:NAD+ synthase [Scytolyngbya sp. HA4215-MV1]
MKIAIAQLNPTIGDLAGNAQQILTAAQQAAAQNVRLLLTPELSLCGYPPRDLLMDPSFVESMATTLQQLAQALPTQLAVLVGTVDPNNKSPQEGGKPLFNSVALLENGKVQQIFHKRLLPTYDVFDEDRYFEPGREVNHFILSLGNTGDAGRSIHIGVTICEDLWNDEEFWGKRSYAINPFSDLAQQGVDLTINLSASPYSAGKQAVREAMLHHSATRFHQPVIYANQVGGNDDLIFDGNSVAFNRAGEVVCRSRSFATDLTIVEYHPEKKDLVPATPTTIAPLPHDLDAEIWAALVLGVCDYARKCGFHKAVIGLSGGIDSALVAAIAAAALGADNVLGVLMPSPYSSDHSVNDALVLAENLGIQTQTLPIGELMQGYDRTLADLFAGTSFGIAEENIQSRIRGNLLMAIANKFGYLLLSTGNKSEMAVGYCTLYGDMNGGLAAIADVPKTRVYSICQWLNTNFGSSILEFGLNSSPKPTSFSEAAQSAIQNPKSDRNPKSEIIPTNILTKAPSAELKPGQVDQDSLPAYDILDDILHRLIHDHQSPAQVVSAGHNAATVNKVVKLVTRAEFKRRQAPPVLKVTDRAFGMGWRMPIASKWVATSD